MAVTLELEVQSLRLAAPFRISGYVFESSDAVVVTLHDGIHRGRGEASGVYYTGDNVSSMIAQIGVVRFAIEGGADRHQLRKLLPPGGARNALDCAMWELEAARTGRPVWELAGVGEPRALRTTFTLGADEPATMAQGAAKYADARSIKIKLTGELDLDIARVAAIRKARPDAWLGVDGNQGFTREQLPRLTAALVEYKVSLLEQPLKRGAEAELEGFKSPIPVAADESILSLDELDRAPGRFDVVNIKLDKCGGLTEGLMIAREARKLGLGVMVGNMVGTSLAMAPAFVLGQECDLVDLDGPTFLARDRSPSVQYRDGDIFAGPEVWGTPATAIA